MAETFNVDNALPFWSPYNWRLSGSTYRHTAQLGAYVKIRWTGTSLALTLDGASSGPILTYSTDNAAWADVTIAGQTSLAIATGLTDTTHETEVWVKFNQIGGTDWVTPVTMVRVTGIVLDDGEALLAVTPKPKRMLVYVDSIGSGFKTVGASSHDATLSFAVGLGEALGAEVGLVGTSNLGFMADGLGGMPELHKPDDATNSSWDKYDASNSRLVDGLLDPAPDYIVLELGANDNAQVDATLTTRVAAALAALREAAPLALIVATIPFSQRKLAAITAGFSRFDDDNSLLVDLGAEGQAGLNSQLGAGVPTRQSPDGFHPYGLRQQQLAMQAATDIALFEDGNPSTAVNLPPRGPFWGKFEITSGDRRPVLILRPLDEAGDYVSLSGVASGLIKWWQRNGAVQYRAAAVLEDATSWHFRYEWQDGDTDLPGNYWLQARAVHEAGITETWPRGYVDLRIIS
jgi:lysophospholipase L1-like esterase